MLMRSMLMMLRHGSRWKLMMLMMLLMCVLL